MRIFLVATAAILIGLSAQTCCAQAKADKKPDPKPAEYHGKPIEYWIKEMNGSDRAKTVYAVEAILNFSHDRAAVVLPAIISLHKTASGLTAVELDPSVRLALTGALGVLLKGNDKLPQFKEGVDRLIASLKDSQYTVRLRAMESLQMLGHSAHAATPEVVSLAQYKGSWELRGVAIRTLLKIADDPKTGMKNDIILVLLDAAEKDPCFQVRLAGIDAVTAMMIHSKDKKTVADRMAYRAEIDPDTMVKLRANLAVIYLHDAVDDKSIKRISDLMKHSDPSVRVKAIETAVRVVLKMTNAVFIPGIIRCLDDEDTTVQLGAIQALGAAGRLGMGAVPVLIGRLDDKYKPMIQIATMAALSQMGWVAAPAVEDIVKKVTDPDPDIQAAAIRALGTMGSNAAYDAGNPKIKKLDEKPETLHKNLTDFAVLPLIKKLEDPNPNIRTLVMTALGQLGDARCVTPLLKLAGNRNPNVQALAIHSIGLMGSRAADVVPSLLPYLKDREDLTVRMMTIQALGSIRGSLAVRPLVELLKDPNLEINLLAVSALAAIGKDASGAVQPLGDFQSGRNIEVRVMVIHAFGAIRSRDAIKALSAELNDPNVTVVTSALDVLAVLGKESKDEVPAIRRCLLHKDNRVAFAASRALLMIGPDAAGAVPDLLKIANDMARPAVLQEYAKYVIQEVTKKNDKEKKK